MRPPQRALLGICLLIGWAVFVVPWLGARIREGRATRAAPPAPMEVEARLALLPAAELAAAPVQQLQPILARAQVLAEAEGEWSRIMASALTQAERQRAVEIADLESPTVPPPFEAPEVDADVIALARVLLDRYGFVDGPAPVAPGQDLWPGADRRARTRGIHALAVRKELSEDAAHVILIATLAFLDQQVERAHTLEQMGKLFSVAMGEG